MAKHVNKVFLLGNLGKDPEIKYLPSGDPVAQFSLATSKSYKDSTGETRETTTWHTVVAYQGLAGVVERIFSKGCLVHIEGEIRHRKIPANDRYPEREITEVVAVDLALCRDPRPASQSDAPPPPPGMKSGNSRPTRASPSQDPAPRQQSRGPAAQQASRQPQTDFDGEDIPFHDGDATV